MSSPLDTAVVDAAVEHLACRDEPLGYGHRPADLPEAGTPGDVHLWRALMRRLDPPDAWTGGSRTRADSAAALNRLRDVTADDMIEVFGPNWMAVRDLVRRAAKLTGPEVYKLSAEHAAVAGVEKHAAWSAWLDAAREAAKDAASNTAKGASTEAGRAAEDSACAAVGSFTVSSAVENTARAVALRDRLLCTPEGAHHYATLTGPWATVIGPAHPDDTPVPAEHAWVINVGTIVTTITASGDFPAKLADLDAAIERYEQARRHRAYRAFARVADPDADALADAQVLAAAEHLAGLRL